MQKLALFDLDSTLVDRVTAMRAWVDELAERYALSAEQREWVLRFDGGARTLRAYIDALCERLGLAEHADLVQLNFRYAMGQAAVYPEVLSEIARLKDSGWKVAVVTNGMGTVQRDKLLVSGLMDLLDGWAISGQEKIAKPDIRLFGAAAAQAGARLSEGGWMIGNDPIRDLAPCRSAGLRTIWMNRCGHAWPDGLERPDHIAVNATEVVELLLGE